MTGHWTHQTAAALVGVHLLLAVIVASLILAAYRMRRRRIRRSQVLVTRIALAAWPPSSALTSPEGGAATDGAGTPDPAPSVAPTVRFRVSYAGGRHRMVA